MTAAVLVPRREGDPHRDAVWAWLQTQLEGDGWDVYEGHHDDGLFNRAAAINRAAAQTDADVLVVMDADTLVDSGQIRAAVAIARDTGTLAFGFHRYCALSEEGTRLVLDGYDGDWEPHVLYEFENTASSCLAVRRDLWNRCGGFDERFVGWGWERCGSLARLPDVRRGYAPRCRGVLAPLASVVPRRGQRAVTDVAPQPCAVSAVHRRRGRRRSHGARRRIQTVIPPILHRCVPAVVPPRWEDHWTRWCGLHPGWQHVTWRDAIDPTKFPRTSPLWNRVHVGAALAGLVRLEALTDIGGIFIDWDLRPVGRHLGPLLDSPGGMFAAWEDADHVPDAVFGCEPHHPAVELLLEGAIERTAAGASVWECSVGLFTEVLPGRDDVTLLPPSSFYGCHYSVERARPGSAAAHVPGPDAYGVHEYAWSWRGDDA